MRKFFYVFLALGICLVLTGPAAAQTPDGETPSEEDVCDGETGAAYGLCNAFCEAMDCDSDDPQASARACERVGDRFEQVTGRVPPCLISCPCFTAEELQEGTIVQCGLIPGFPDLAGIVYADGRRGCSGFLCASVNTRSCAIIRPSGELFIVDPITEEEDLGCRTLIFEACPGPTLDDPSVAPPEDSSTPFIDG